MGRLYMHNLFDCLHKLGERSKVKLDQSFYEDIRWWELCARQNNGIEIGVGDRVTIQLMLLIGNTIRSWGAKGELSKLANKAHVGLAQIQYCM